MTKKKTTKKLDPINAHIGLKIRQRRGFLGISQADLAKACGIKSQQIIHTYETGINSISTSRLFTISKALGVPVAFFFEGVKGMLSSPAKQAGFAEDKQPDLEGDPMGKKETLDLIRAYYSIQDPKLRKRLLEMAKAMADAN